MAGSIILCPERPNQAGPGELKACEQQPSQPPGTIVVCETSWQEVSTSTCEAAQPLTLSGDETPEENEVYTVSGGVPPYSWSYNGGATLTPSGTGGSAVLTSESSGCGSETITVSDACGESVSLTIRHSSGQWVNVSTEYPCAQPFSCDWTYDPEGDSYIFAKINVTPNCTDCSIGPNTVPEACALNGHIGNIASMGISAGDAIQCGGVTEGDCSGCTGDRCRCAFLREKRVYQWQCNP